MPVERCHFWQRGMLNQDIVKGKKLSIAAGSHPLSGGKRGN